MGKILWNFLREIIELSVCIRYGDIIYGAMLYLYLPSSFIIILNHIHTHTAAG